MPNLYTHISFGKDVLDCLPDEVRKVTDSECGAYELGCLGPDFLFILRETGIGNVKDYALKMHYTKVYESFEAIADYIRKNGSDAKLSYAYGLMCHYALDSTLHPYVFETTERYAHTMLPEKAASKAHHFIESAIDEYYIKDKKVNDGYKVHASGKIKAEIGELYEKAINGVFGEKLKSKEVKFAYFMAKLALKVSRDRTGLNGKGIRLAEKLFFKGEYKFTSLIRPPIGYGEVDYFNIERRPFGVTRGGEETENATVQELLDRAERKARKYISAFYHWIIDGEPMSEVSFDINYEGQQIISDREKFIIVSREVMTKYHSAFEELAK